MRFSAVVLLFLLAASSVQAADSFDVYVIDAEGGNAKLVVSPAGRSMLLDPGWPGFNGRDADRIAAAAAAAGVKQIDYLVITHLDVDHVGDLPLVATKIPIRRILDNGPLQTTGKGVEKRYEAYAAFRDKLEHATLNPGETIPFDGVEVRVVAAATKVLEKPLAGAGMANSACAANAQPAEITGDREDNMSIGLLFAWGQFRMLDLSDLEGYYSYKLACPNNLIGAVDVYSVSVHGQAKGSSPALEQAMRPRVAIMNNGAKKGGDPQTWPVLRATPGLEDIWQLHFSVAGGKENNPPEDFIANLEPVNCQGKWLKVSAARDGAFTVTNARNGFSKTYGTRK
jgi:beta-lactamase superfamily II metal-dependent hydrolase